MSAIASDRLPALVDASGRDARQERAQEELRLARLEASLRRLGAAPDGAGALAARITDAAAARPLPQAAPSHPAAAVAEAGLAALPLVVLGLLWPAALPLQAALVAALLPLAIPALARVGDRQPAPRGAVLVAVCAGQTLAMITALVAQLSGLVAAEIAAPASALALALALLALLHEARLRVRGAAPEQVQRAAASTRVLWTVLVGTLLLAG